MKKLLLVFGTRPEAIKMAPVYHSLRKHLDEIEVIVCVTGQHRQMLDMVVNFFDIHVDYDMNIMRDNQTLFTISADIFSKLSDILDEVRPDWVIVHGDTTTSTIAALCAFYSRIKVAHVEAGLRTFNKFAPFPEEMNRVLTSKLADIHFAPTNKAAENLINEGVSEKDILVTGNTVIDALFMGLTRVRELENSAIMLIKQTVSETRKIVLVTAHRRENFGAGFESLCQAIRELALEFRDSIQVIFPVHLNPNVRDPVHKILNGISNILLIEPLDYESFIWVMNNSSLIITDSGGVQEEAPSLGKPVLVIRETTERPEAVEAGTVVLVGTDKAKIISYSRDILLSRECKTYYPVPDNPYGDGLASQRITDFFIKN